VAADLDCATEPDKGGDPWPSEDVGNNSVAPVVEHFSMTTTTDPSERSGSKRRAGERASAGSDSPEQQQLQLLPADDVPVRFRLSTRTRLLGLEGVAQARAILASQAARRRQEAVDAGHLAPPHAA